MKYIDTEKLIALIDTKLEDLGMSGSVWVGRSVLNELKEDIKSLQQNQSEVNLEKELKEHIDDEWSDEWSGDVGNWIRYRRGTTSMEVEDVKEIARHFYERGLNARKEEL